MDDERNILQGLQRMLRSRRNIWEMTFVTSGKEALQLMRQKSFDAIVSDMMMPEIDGVQLLTAVMKQFPQTIRFILSGQMSNEELIRAIGPCHQIITKPCNPEDLIFSIERALKLRNLLNDDKLRSVISQIKTLPSLPSLYLQLEDEMKSPMCSVKKVAEIIEQDVAMSAKVLHIINSPYFGLCSRVTDITQAVRLLGLDIIKSLVFMTQLFSILQNNNPLSDCLDVIWRHSLNVSIISKQIAKLLQLPKYEEDAVFKSGLFHDIGKIILSTRLSDVFLECLRRAEMEGISCWEAEMAVIGVSHAEIGAYLLGLWGVSDHIVEAVFFHHRPEESECRDCNGISIVHGANSLEHEKFKKNSLVSTNQKLNTEFLQNLEYYETVMTFFNAYGEKNLNARLM